MVASYPYQDRVYAALMRGRNVILQAPTGAGKTRAGLQPLFAILDSDADPASLPLPPTCRYAVPMRVLATQFQKEWQANVAQFDQRRGLSLLRTYQEKLGVHVPAIQTGETPDDPPFASPLTFCTIDQLLASFIGSPYSISRSQANLNVGAVAGSYLILDEFHLYPLEHGQGARLTALAMLRLLRGFSPFVVMTATFSSTLLTELGEFLDAEVITVEGDDELARIMKGRGRTIRRAAEPMTAADILAAHDAARAREAGASLVVCNTVARAQATYLALRDELVARGERDRVELHLLHSRFTPGDRKTKSEQLEALLGEKQWRDGRYLGPDTIIVGTQVVEVGLNISAGVLHTEIAPANSVIQRAGRCARFAQQQGEVIVYPLPPAAKKSPDNKDKISYLPYPESLCVATFDRLTEDAQEFGFREEQALIDAVHTDEDRQMLETLRTTLNRTTDTIADVLRSHAPGNEGELIRDVRSVAVVVHASPGDAMATHPYEWESFGLRPETLIGALAALDTRRAALSPGVDPGWTMKLMREAGERDADDEADNSRERYYQWDTISNRQQIATAQRIALPPELATYDSDLGFRLLIAPGDPVGTWQSQRQRPGKKGDREPGKLGSYVGHISGLLRAYDFTIRHDTAWLAKRLEDALGLDPGSVDHAIRLAIACHDIGKLSRGWQAWARAWQAIVVREQGPGYAGYAIQPGNEWLAKTDRLPGKEWQREHKLQEQIKPKRPHHAGEGAVASIPLVAGRLTAGRAAEDIPRYFPLVQAIIGAVARHHAPTATTHQAVAWEPAARPALAAAFRACRLDPDVTALDLSARKEGEIPTDYFCQPTFNATNDGIERSAAENTAATWLAFTVVRALRLADQRAEKEW